MIEKLKQKYLDLCHAMQSGVAFRRNKTDQEPKHLRVGVNAAMCDTTSIAKLLLAKGVFTEEEFYSTLCETMQEEVDRYRQAIADETGSPIERIHLA